jgi:hypothetical protein
MFVLAVNQPEHEPYHSLSSVPEVINGGAMPSIHIGLYDLVLIIK